MPAARACRPSYFLCGDVGQMEPLFEFWAKSGREGEPAPMDSVPHHSLDDAASAVVLLTAFRSPVDVPAATLATPMPPRLSRTRLHTPSVWVRSSSVPNSPLLSVRSGAAPPYPGQWI